jgi:hypothetical protein
MAEQDRPSNAPQTARTWDVEAIACSLNGVPQKRSDQAFGAGVRFRLGQRQETELELFPAAGVVRLTTPDLQLAILGQTEPPTIAATGIVFTRSEPSHRSLAIAREGTLTLVATPPPPETVQTAADDIAAMQRAEGHFAAEEGLTDDPVAPEGMLQQALPSDRRAGQPRVTFAGRLGRDPRCRTTPREIRVCTFPVAEKRDAAETPNWLTIVAFKALAAKVEATLKKGMFVEGIGYEHQHERKGRDGATRSEAEIYAVVITPR